MKLKIENGLLYVDNQRFCFAEVEGMDGNLPTGPRAVVTQYSADHGDILPRVADYGWDTDGTVLYSSDNFDEDGAPILLAEPFIHHYAGWEV